MPGRQAHGTKASKRVRPRNSQKSRSLNALSIASKLADKKKETKKRPWNGKTENHDGDDEDEDDLGGVSNQLYPKKRKNRQKHECFDELELDKGSDSEGNEWKLGQVDTDNDSELDSDEAFGESDAERFDGLVFSGSSKTQKNVQKRAGVDLCEENKTTSSTESEASDVGEDTVDLASMLDSSGTGKAIAQENIPSDAESELESDSGESSEDDLFSTSSLSSDEKEDETSDPAKMLALQNLISNLSQTDEHQSQIEERYNDPNEFNTTSDYGIMPKKKLTLDDLGLRTVTDPNVKQSLKVLASANKKSTAKLEVPLARRQQDRIDRSAAYEKSKETLDRWVETVKLNRRADHIIFPLTDHGMAAAKSNKELLPLNSSEPHNELEAAIKNILDESGLATEQGKDDEDRIIELEKLETSHMSIDQIKAGRNRLRMARELMFREEARSKRIKKIKSKSYRRVHRKERENLARLQEQALEENGVNPSIDELESRDRKRAEERMGARHRGSKWAKSIKDSKRAMWDEEARSGIAEMARRDEELRKRVDGKIVRKEYEDSDTSSESDDESYESGESSKRELTLRKLEAERYSNSIDESVPGARLANMDFMRRADAARKKQNDAMIEEIRREINNEPSEQASEDEAEIGRRIFGKYGGTEPTEQKSAHMNEFEERVPSSDEEEESSKLNDTEPSENSAKTRQNMSKMKLKHEKRFVKTADAAQNSEGGAWSKPHHKFTGGLDSEASRKKYKKKNIVDIEELDLSKAEEISKRRKISAPTSQPANLDDSDDNSTKSFSLIDNQELIKRTFAGADVVGEFEAEKKQVIKDEDDKMIDNTLPGWGSWVGNGVSKKYLKSNKNRFLSTVKGVKASNRRDINLQRVIINEKKVKKVFISMLRF